jgi:hypothetical protein
VFAVEKLAPALVLANSGLGDGRQAFQTLTQPLCCLLLSLFLLQSVLAGEKLAPALLDFAQRSSKQQPKPEEGAEVAAAPAAAALDDQ